MLGAYIKDQIKKLSQPYNFEEELKINRQEDIKRIYFYRRDKFMECEDDKAIFWQLATPTRRENFKKNIKPSIKDFYPEGRGDFNVFQAWLTKVAFRKWARETGFVYDVEDVSTDLTDFGEGIWKTLPKDEDKDIQTCDLRRVYFDRTVDFENSDKIEVHELTISQLWDKDGSWDNIQEIIDHGEKVEESGMTKYKIYEFEGWYSEEPDDRPEKIHAFVTGAGDNEIIAFQEDLKKDETRYVYFKLNDELSGVFQRLFVLQELCNRRVNQNDESQQIASLLLLKSANPAINGNVLHDAVNGQIVPDPTLQQVGIDNRAVAAFAQEMMMFEAQADRLCMTPEVLTGDSLPSGTPFRSVATLTNKATSAFRAIRLNIAEKVNEVLVNDIFPYVTSSWEKKFLEIAGDDNDIREYDRIVSMVELNKWAEEQREASGKLPTWEEIQVKKQEILNGVENVGRKIFIEKGFFNWKFGMIYNHSNEIEDKAQQNDTINNLLQYKMANPAIANDPLFKQLAEKNGIPAFKVSVEEMQQLQSVQSPNIKATQDKLMAAVDSNV